MQIFFTSSSKIHAINVPDQEVIFVMPFTDPKAAKKSSALLASRAGNEGLLICIFDENSDGYINIANRVFEKTNSTWFGYVAQDAFAGRNWLRFALKALEKTNGALLGFNDGKWAGELAAFGLTERAWARNNYQGPLFHSRYTQHYADVELTLLAQACGRYVYEPNSVVIEIDWEKDKKAVNMQDKQLFSERIKTQFDDRKIPSNLLQKFT